MAEEIKYRFEISFQADFKDRELIADEFTRVFEAFMHKKHLINGNITLDVRPMNGGFYMRLLDEKIKSKS